MHAIAHAINESLGSRGIGFDMIEPVVKPPADRAQSLPLLISEMQAGQVDHLLIVDSNPAATAPAVWRFPQALERVPFSLALARSADETARLAKWFVPQAHPWGVVGRCPRVRWHGVHLAASSAALV